MMWTLSPAEVKARANDNDDWSLHGKYTSGKNAFFAGTADSKNITAGYIRTLAKSTSMHVELLDDEATGDTEYAVGFIQKF